MRADHACPGPSTISAGCVPSAASANGSTDPDVVWGMAQFQLADYVDLSDPRFSQIMGGLVAKGIVTQARADQIYTDLMALANA